MIITIVLLQESSHFKHNSHSYQTWKEINEV